MEPTQQSAQPAKENEYEAILDGVNRELTFLVDDPESPGKKKQETERRLIRRISIQKMDTLARAWGKMQAEVCCYLDMPLARVEQLTDESFETAMTEGRRLNFTSFTKWYRWQAQTLEALGQNEQIGAVVKELGEKIIAERASVS